jgi:predicted acetyltransferase
VEEVYAERARRTAGQLDRNEWAWARVGYVREGKSRGFLVVGPDGKPEGYFVLVLKTSPGDLPYELDLHDLVVLTPEAGRRILTFLADYRSMSKHFSWNGAPTEPFEYLVGEDGMEVDWRAVWMLRIVDVKGALEARGYSPAVEGELHLEVADDLLPWNDGRFVLRVANGRGEVRKGGRGSVRLDVRALAPLYTRYLTPRELAAAARIEGSERELAKAAALFSGPQPWLVDFF